MIDQGLAQAIDILGSNSVLETGDRRTGGERSFSLIGIKGLSAYAQAKHGITAQAVAVIAILVSGGDLIDALFENVVQGMGDVARMPGIVDGCAHALGETDLAINALE